MAVVSFNNRTARLVNPGDTIPGRTRVTAITLFGSATGNQAILRNGGASGMIFYSGPNSATNVIPVHIAFCDGQDFDDLTLSAINDGTVIVYQE